MITMTSYILWVLSSFIGICIENSPEAEQGAQVSLSHLSAVRGGCCVYLPFLEKSQLRARSSLPLKRWDFELGFSMRYVRELSEGEGQEVSTKENFLLRC